MAAVDGATVDENTDTVMSQKANEKPPLQQRVLQPINGNEQARNSKTNDGHKKQTSHSSVPGSAQKRKRDNVQNENVLPPSAKRHKGDAAFMTEGMYVPGLGWSAEEFLERQTWRRDATPRCDLMAKSPVYCAAYAADIFANLCLDELEYMPDELFLQSLRCPSPTCSKMPKLIDDRVRTIMIDWLHKVWARFKLKDEVMYHSIHLLDRYCSERFMQGRPVKRDEYQRIGCACMWTSSKYNEIYAPEMADFVKIASNQFSAEQLQREERDILTVLDFELTTPSLHTLTRRLIAVAEPDLVGNRKERSKHVAMYLIEFSLHDTQVLTFPPSLVAAAAVYLGIVMTKSGEWTEDLVNVSGYKREDLKLVLAILREFIINPNKLVKSVRERYKKDEHGGVSKLITKRS